MNGIWPFKKLAWFVAVCNVIAITLSAYLTYTRRDAPWWGFAAQLFSLISLSFAAGIATSNLIATYWRDKLDKPRNATSGLQPAAADNNRRNDGTR